MANIRPNLRLPLARIVRPLDAVSPNKAATLPKAPARALVPLDDKCDIHFQIPIAEIAKRLRGPRPPFDPSTIQVSARRTVTLMQIVVPLEDVRPKK